MGVANEETSYMPSLLMIFMQIHYTVRIKKKVIHIQRSVVLKTIDFKICIWHESKEQLIIFPLVPFLDQVCHAWLSKLPIKMTMSWPTFSKFWQCDKSFIAKQCNYVAAENVSSHAKWSFSFTKMEIIRSFKFFLCSLVFYGPIWHKLVDIWASFWSW